MFKRILTVFFSSLVALSLLASILVPVLHADAKSSSGSSVYVRGYTKSNGTYVEPHYRSAPDGDPTNNYSYPGNTNPYTGETATGDPSTYIKNTDPGYPSGGAPAIVQPAPPPVPVVAPWVPPVSKSSAQKFNVKWGKNNSVVFTQQFPVAVLAGGLIKSEKDTKIYVGDEKGCLRWATRPGVLTRMFGDGWNKSVMTVDEKIMKKYKVCQPVLE